MEDNTTEEVEGTNLMNRDIVSIDHKKVPSSMKKYEVGKHYDTREQLARTGIHPPFMSGIHPGGRDTPAQSIVMSGGYEDDVDRGDIVVYTGQGGQQAGSNVQIADQKMERGNLSLKLACDRGLPIHVTRGFKGHSPFAPPSGYRYDGLYIIERYWQETGKHGFKVWRYQMRRLEGQPALPEPKETTKTFKARQPRQTPAKAAPEKKRYVLLSPSFKAKRKRKSKRSKEEEEVSSESDTEATPNGVEMSQTENGQQQTCGYCHSYDFMTNGTHKCIDHLEKHKAEWIKKLSQQVTKGGYQFETSDPLTDLTQRFYLNQMRVRAAIEEEEIVCKAEDFMYQDELFLEQALQNLLWNTEEQEESSEQTTTLPEETPVNLLQAYSAWTTKDKETGIVN